MLAETMLELAEDYYWQMVAKHRLIYLDQLGLCTFFLLKDEAEVPHFYDRPCWSIPEDSPEGTIVYVDKIITRYFDRNLFRAIERAVTERHPQWRLAVWYRPSQSDIPGQDSDRRYTYRRKEL